MAPIDAEREKANAVMSRIGADLQNEAKDDYESGKSSSRKDILSLLVRANDLPEALRLREENVVSRAYKLILKGVYLLNILSEIPNLLIASHETTGYTHPSFRLSEIKVDNLSSWHSVTISWALYSLTQNKDIEPKIREELSKVSTDNPTMDDLNGLPYLDAVVGGLCVCIRRFPMLYGRRRFTIVSPLSKPLTNRKGIVHNEIRLVLL